MSLAITNIGSLVTNDPNLGIGILGELENATLVIEDMSSVSKDVFVSILISSPTVDKLEMLKVVRFGLLFITISFKRIN
jgi:hypothetical protein